MSSQVQQQMLPPGELILVEEGEKDLEGTLFGRGKPSTYLGARENWVGVFLILV